MPDPDTTPPDLSGRWVGDVFTPFCPHELDAPAMLEWGWREPWGDVRKAWDEAEARLWVERSAPGARVLVSRFVSEWRDAK